MNTREQIREILVELIPKPYKDYNQGLLPDEDGYDTDKLERIYNWEEEINEATKQIQYLIDDARIDELEKAEIHADRIYPECDDILDHIEARIAELQERKNNE